MKMPDQRGLTLIELLLAMAITGLILPLLVSSLVQISRGTTKINRDLVVRLDIDGASVFFNRDLSLAQTTDLASGASANHVRMDWIDQTAYAVPGQEAHCAEYTVASPNLLRNYDGTTVIVARNVKSILFTHQVSANGTHFVTTAFASTYGGASQQLSYVITPRSKDALKTAPPPGACL